MPILLVDADPTWPHAYANARDELLEALGNDAFLGFEHIGSTSVPELAAKPLVDMMAGVHRVDDALQLIGPLEALGYTHLKDVAKALPGRHLFERRDRADGPEPLGLRVDLHLHVVEYGGSNWERHLRFRDWLRVHPGDRFEYEALKRELATRYDDTTRYSEAKTGFVREIEARAARAQR